ncbi:zinc finger, CCHC-type containing protein [Tanacetum coccineum]
MFANQTTNNNSIRSILDKEKLNGINFLDWYRNLRIVLKNEQKSHHLEEALPKAPPATATVVVRNAYTLRVAEQQEVFCLMLVSMTPEIQKNLEDRTAFEILQELKTMFQQQAEQELFKIVKAFHACKQEEGQSVSTCVLKMKAYLDQMERLGYPMPLVLGVNLILTSLSKTMTTRGKGKKKGKGKSKLAYDPKHKIPPPAKKEHPAKDAECHHYHKTRHWRMNSPLYLAELKKNKASTSGTSSIFTIELYSFPKSALDLYVGNGNRVAVEAIRSFDLTLPSGMKRITKLQHDGLLESTDDESFDVCVFCISGKMERKPFTHGSERTDDLLGLIYSDVCGSFRTTSREDSVAPILNMVSTKKVNKTPYEIWHGKVPNLSYLKVWGCEALVKRDTPNKLESIVINCIFVGYPKEMMCYYFYYPTENKIFVARQDKQPSNNTSEHQPEDEHDDVHPQTDVNPVRRSVRIPRAPERYGFYIDAEEHELGDHGEPPNNQAALSDIEFEKRLKAMNTKMKSLKDNQVWTLVDLPPDYKTVGSKWLFKKKTIIDGNIHTYKARLVAK